MSRTFPTAEKYIAAIEKPQNFVLDPVLRRGCPKRRKRDDEVLYYAGGFARVFVIQCDDKTYAMRCWVREIGGDARRRYQTVSECLRETSLPHFTDFEYVDSGIFVEKESYPIVRMEWVEALSLREFIGQHRYRREVLEAAAKNFLTMAQALHERKIAHGDLQNENIKVYLKGEEPEFVLIDYDTLYVPGLIDTSITTTGVPGFQHPKREAVATEKDDYFAELVIYLTLLAIAEEPRLWDEFRMEEREKELIFDGTDFSSAVPTRRFQRLRQLSPPIDRLTLLLWNFTRHCEIERLVPLEQAEALCTGKAPPCLEGPAKPPSSEEWFKEWREGSPPRVVPSPGHAFDELLQRLQSRAPDILPSKALDSDFSALLASLQGTTGRPSCSTESPAGNFDQLLARLEAEPQPPPEEQPQPPASDSAPSQWAKWLLIALVIILLLIWLSHR